MSQLVLDEAGAGDPDAAARRLIALREAAVLDVTTEAIALGRHLVAAGGLPTKAGADALYIAIAAVHGIDYLLTWNCTHIANARLRGKIEGLCRGAGYDPPMLWGDDYADDDVARRTRRLGDLRRGQGGRRWRDTTMHGHAPVRRLSVLR